MSDRRAWESMMAASCARSRFTKISTKFHTALSAQLLLGVVMMDVSYLPGESLAVPWCSRGSTMLATRSLTWGTEKRAWMN